MYGPDTLANGGELTRTGSVKDNGTTYVRKVG